MTTQLSIFPDHSGAIFSNCRKYRYVLWRIWDFHLPKIMFIGLNPSKADESKNDPTIRRVINFAKNWGYGGVYMTNLFAYITTDPEKIVYTDPGINDKWLLEVSHKCEKVIFAWGVFKETKEVAKKIIEMFPEAYCLYKNKNGSPRHPLYVKSNVKPIKF